jgi:hypothetical protein
VEAGGPANILYFNIMRQSLEFVERILPRAPDRPKAKTGNKAIDFYEIAKQLSNFATSFFHSLLIADAEFLIRLLRWYLKLPQPM